MWTKFAVVLSALYWCVHLQWVKFNKFLNQLYIPRANEGSRKIVIIGDEFAEGYGDWILLGQPPGCGPYLQVHIRQDERIHLDWWVCNCGAYGATTSDWLPPTINDQTQSQNPSKKLWNSVFESKWFNDAEVIVIILGAADLNDAELSPIKTVSNLREICSQLRADGKRVFLATLPTHGVTGVRLEKLLARNRLINLMIEEQSLVHGAIKLDEDSNSVYKRADLYCADGRHFSHNGYKQLGKDVASALVNELVKIQFAFFKTKLKL